MLFLQAASNPKRIHTTFRLIESGTVELYVSVEVLAEVRDVLSRPRHKEKFPALTDEHVGRFLAAIASQSKLVDVVPSIYTVDRDPKDSKYVNLALAASAEYLVSWDQHLLGLMDELSAEGTDFRRRFPTLQVLDPVRFVAAVAPAVP
jgi:putative PIN family toxin of toxin-antitoxin system